MVIPKINSLSTHVGGNKGVDLIISGIGFGDDVQKV